MSIERDDRVVHIFRCVDTTGGKDEHVDLCWHCAGVHGENVDVLEAARVGAQCTGCGATNGFEVIQHRAKIADRNNAVRYF